MEKKGLGSIWSSKKSYTKTFGLVGEVDSPNRWAPVSRTMHKINGKPHCEINSQSTNTRYSRG